MQKTVIVETTVMVQRLNKSSMMKHAFMMWAICPTSSFTVWSTIARNFQSFIHPEGNRFNAHSHDNNLRKCLTVFACWSIVASFIEISHHTTFSAHKPHQESKIYSSLTSARLHSSRNMGTWIVLNLKHNLQNTAI